MRIGVNLLSESRRSAGVKTYVAQLLKTLARMNGEHEYFIFVSRDNLESYYVEDEKLTFVSFWFPTGSAPLRRLLEQVVTPFLARRLSVDLVHSVNNVGLMLTRVPTVVTIHDMSPLRLRHRFGMAKRWYLATFVPISAKRARRILAVTQAAKKEITELCGVDDGKVAVAHHGVSDRFSPPTKDERIELKDKWSIQSDYVLYVGTLEPGKNIPRIIEAFSTLIPGVGDEYSLVIAGRPGWQDEEIYEITRKLNLSSKVIFTGHVSPDDLPQLYRGAALFVFPSLYEGFGLPVLEAMACGTPVITSNISSLPEVAGDAAILVDPYNVDEIADAMVRVLSDEALRRELSSKGKERAKLFTWEKCAQETLSVYEEVYRESR